jgi:hypothetical protein
MAEERFTRICKTGPMEKKPYFLAAGIIILIGLVICVVLADPMVDITKADADHIYLFSISKDDYQENPSAYAKGWKDGWHWIEKQNLVEMTHTDIEVAAGYKEMEFYGKPDLNAKEVTPAIEERAYKVYGFQNAVDTYLKSRRPERAQ